MPERRGWTRKETVLAVELYCRTPFGKIHNRNREVIELAQRIGRTPNSVALKMANFASLDTTLDRAGMRNHSKLDKEIWDEFFVNPDEFLESAIQAADLNYVQEDSRAYPEGFREGGEYMVVTKARKNQDYFRQMVLAAYNVKCAITGINAPELLIASHIMPWSSHSSNRTDPRNGICLNALHDKAFDKGLLSFDEQYRILLSPKITNKHEFFDKYAGQKITLPDRFRPLPEFVRHHRENIFKAA
jgi:putative restriction endonuclease